MSLRHRQGWLGASITIVAALGATGMLTGCAATAVNADNDYDFSTDYPACMSDLGWDSVKDTDGGVITNIPSGQRSAYTAARDQCLELIGASDRPAPTTEQLKSLYDAQLASRECLIQEGFTLPEPPSEQVFLESAGAWSPYIALPDDALSEGFDELVKRCPQPTAESLAN